VVDMARLQFQQPW